MDLSEERIAACVRGELSPAERAAVESAIDRAPQWLEIVALLARRSEDDRIGDEASDDPASSRSDDTRSTLVEALEREQSQRLHRGARLGRYVIDHPSVGGHALFAKAHTLRADARIGLGRPAEAISDLELALALERRMLGADHSSVGVAQSNLGVAYHDLGRYDEAAMHLRESLDLLEASLGASHPSLGFVLTSLGVTVHAQGHHGEALALFGRAASLGDPVVEHDALRRTGELLLERGEVSEAIATLQRALEVHAQIQSAPARRGYALFALARARWAAGQRREARADAQAALSIHEGGDDDERVTEIRRWLASHPGPR